MLIPFSAIIGQQRAKDFLATVFNKGSVSHAYLLKGPSGVGKKMLAHAFAALLNCQAAQGTEVCGHCPSCKKFASGNHPDLLVIEPEGAGIKISQIRELQQQLSFAPFEAQTRLVILPDIHDTMRRAEVANALLKTLEEPPLHSKLILTADESGAVLPTILSRCQIVPLFPLPAEQLTQMLVAEELPLARAHTLAALSEGSLGRAKSLQESNLLERRQQLISQLTELEEDSPLAVQQVFAMAADCAELKEQTSDLLDLLASWLRDLLLLISGSGANILNHDLVEQLNQGASCWNHQALQAKVVALDQARRQLARNCNRTMVLEVLFFALLAEKC